MTADQIVGRVNAIIWEFIDRGAGVDRDEIKPDASLESLDMDSLDVVELGLALEEFLDDELDVEANFSDVDWSCVGDVHAAVLNAVIPDGAVA